MLSESEIQNFKKIFLGEVIIEVEKIIDKLFEKAINMDSSEIHDETPPVLRAYLDDNFVVDPALSREENFKNGVRLLKEFHRIEQKEH